MKPSYTNNQIIEETCKVLDSNPTWINRYHRLANTIVGNKEAYEKIKRSFRTHGELHTFTSATRPKSNMIDLRFAGMSIGDIQVPKGKEGEKDDVYFIVNQKQAEKANVLKEYYDKNVTFSSFNEKWRSPKADEYRRFFCGISSTKDLKQIVHKKEERKFSEERRIEQWVLDEMEKKKHGLLYNIVPITYCGHFFQMPTPFKACKHEVLPEYSKGYGGIDILATVTDGSNKTNNYLAVIEIKDENNEDESQKKTIQQALIYATFLAKLLGSKSGLIWWKKIFGKTTDIPQNLSIYAITLMPHEGKSEEWDGEEPYLVNVDGFKNVSIYPHRLYYEPDKSGNPLHFSGSLKCVLPKK